MFSWSISKSGEAMFSRWAVKRICKFVLKKKLGKFILGDIDLNQINVQLVAGIIQLSDLALNVAYINEKFGNAPVLVKEGSVGSLMITMPWKDGGFRVEVDELEIVIAPRQVKVCQDEFESCSPSKKGNNNSSYGFRKEDNGTANNATSVEVHEGVKTIAKMVKWLLTSFHVKIKKLIVAFDPLLEEENEKRLDRILVLRISEAECGTRISEDASSSSFTTAHNFLGLSRLTSFIKFEGAVVELLHVDGFDHQSPPEGPTETSLASSFFGCSSSGNMTTIIAGEKGGFSGNMKLSIPWKNGSLDIRKVDANLHIEPLDIRLNPSSIRCFIFMWDLFKGIGDVNEDPVHRGPSDSSSMTNSCMHPSDKGLLGNEGFVTNSYLAEKEPLNTLLSESHLISDWVSRSEKGNIEEEPDFGESVDQFFECLDGLRNSQSALGNSGMWNWTCSVFSAITAASNLASGSLHVPSEPQHVETNFNATIAKVSILLSFIDEDQKQTPEIKGDIHCVCAQFVGVSLLFEVRPRKMNFEVIMQHIQLVDHLCPGNPLMDHKGHGCNDNSENEIALIRRMQDGVQGALLTFHESSKVPRTAHQVDYSVDISLNIQETDACCHMTNGKGICGKEASLTLLKTAGASQCHVRVNTGSSDGSASGPTSFSLKLSPFVFWVNLDLVTMAVEFLKEMENCIEATHLGSGFVPKSETKGGQRKISRGKSTKKNLEINIFLPNARIILCFPLKERNLSGSDSSCNHFIAFDFTSPKNGKDVRSAKPKCVASSSKKHAVAASCSLNLNLGNFYLFLVSSVFTENSVGSETYSRQKTSFSAEKIISILNEPGCLSLICMFWHDDPATGPWIVKKAQLLASSENRSKDKVVGKGCEFASVTTVKDITNFDNRTRQEILSSSQFLRHVQLPPVTINLDKSQYENICGLLNQTFEHFSSVVSDSARTRVERAALQSSILLECNSLTVSFAIEPVGDVKSSIRAELPGSWVSLTLQVDKFELLSVSDIGGIRSANFLWVAHGQGSLWGSVTEGLHQEFLLISCSNSTMGRGDGEDSNVLSSRYSGSDIINLWDPESNHNFTSITVRGATIVAIGGRLDWFNTIISFFSLPSSESEQAGDKSLKQCRGSSFILNLVDVGLSYEPYFKKVVANLGSDLKCSDMDANEARDEFCYASLLAASSLKLSNTTVVDCTVGEYKIRLQDLGLLLRAVSESKFVHGTYSGEHLSRIGYVKVAQEANVEALLRTNCENGHAWELDCVDSHIMLTTCHDTTFGLIRLATQLQKLLAPDMQDYVAHLENRWKNVQQAQENNEERTLGGEDSSAVTQTQMSSLDKRPKVGNLMDEVLEDVFQLDGNSDGQSKFFKSLPHTVFDDNSIVASGASSSEKKIPDFIEEYFLSDLRPLSDLVKSPSSDISFCKTGALGGNQIGNGGWSATTPLKILENHASKLEHTNVQKLLLVKDSTSDSEHVDVGKAEGHILLKNMNVIWRMYGGSDWSNFQSTSQPSTMTCGRDATVCLELALSGVGLDYDVYPDGEICASRLSLSIQDLCVNDRSDDAPWKLVLGYYQSKKRPRKSYSKAVKLNLETVKPDPSIRVEENRLRIALLPLRLHLHQSQLDFLISFFGGKTSSADSSPGTPSALSKSGEPFQKGDNFQGCVISEEGFLPYFQKFEILPMLIRVDYSPCRVDLTALRGGKYVELVNLVPWKGVELQLKHVQGVGLYGWSSVGETILGEWLEDISQNQIHKLLKGLPPIKSLVAVGFGAAKLVSLPVKNYKKDHKLLKGVQRGTFAFLRSISLEAIGLGVHLAAGAHEVLLQAEYILTTIPPSVPWPVESRMGTNVRSNQPKDAQQGIQQACQSISDGLGKSASALLQTPLRRYLHGDGMGSALATVVQAAPAAAIAPAASAARAVHCALLGFRNSCSLDPEHKRESVEKYSGRTPPRDSMQ